MSNNNNGAPQGGNPFAGGATYQSIIIALVAAGVLSTGLVTLVWRRKRYRQLEREMDRAVRDGRERYRTRREMEERTRLAAHAGNGSGPSPQIWDAVVGEKLPAAQSSGPEHRRGTAAEQGEKAGMAEGNEEWEDDVDVGGLMKVGWTVGLQGWQYGVVLSVQPTSVTFVRSGESGIQSRAAYSAAPTMAEVSVLIAMPSEEQARSLAFTGLDGPQRAGGLTVPSALPPYTGTPNRKSGQYPTSYTADEDTESFPPLQLATTVAPVAAGSMAEREELDRMVSEARGAIGGHNPALNGGLGVRPGDGWTGNLSNTGNTGGANPTGRRFERADGFRE